jgi:hypothetical protein
MAGGPGSVSCLLAGTVKPISVLSILVLLPESHLSL